MAQKGRGIFMVYVDIDAQYAPEFNDWYNEEHLPELLSVPGILSASRYEAVKGWAEILWHAMNWQAWRSCRRRRLSPTAADAVGKEGLALQ